MPKELAKAYICACGKTHPFGVWVFAHWRERLIHTCDACGRKNTIQKGQVVRSQDAQRKAVP